MTATKDWPAYQHDHRRSGRTGEQIGIVQCEKCKHGRVPGKCDAFPDGVPLEIAAGEHDHRVPFPGDNGIRFEAKEEE